jgi:uncharacterized protein (TIGR03067 family)
MREATRAGTALTLTIDRPSIVRPFPRRFAVKAYFLIAITGLFVAEKDDPTKDDLAKLSGTWLTVSLVSDGKSLVDEKARPAGALATKLVYEQNTWMVKVGDKTVAAGKFKIDAAKSPKEIDILDESGVKNEKTKLGIYEIDGDTYKYCLAPAGKPRPAEFASSPGSRHSLGVSKREKH